MGKSLLLSYYIENFVENNNDQDIVFFNDDKKRNAFSKDRLIRDIRHVTVSKKYIGAYEIAFKNENYLRFCSIQESYVHFLFRLKPSLIIYDEFCHKNLNKYNDLFLYLLNNRCKVIFTSTYIDTRVIKLLDYRNDFYINIKRITEDNIEPKFKNYDYDSLIRKELSYKTTELLDFDDTIYQRRKKLKELNDISNGI